MMSLDATRKLWLARIELLAHVAPLGWRHISLTGDYLWQNAAAELDRDGFRPLNLRDEPGTRVA